MGWALSLKTTCKKVVEKVQPYWQRYGYWIAWVLFIAALVHISWLSITKVGVESDLSFYYNYTQDYLVEHKIPYGTFSPEYPPGAFLLFMLARVFAPSLDAYKTSFTLITALVLLIGAFFLARGKKPFSLLLFALFLYSCRLELVFQRFDAIVGILIMISLLQFSRQKYSSSIILLALSTGLKLFPAVLLPFYLLLLPNNGLRWRQLVLFTVVNLVLLVPFFFIGANLQGLWYFIDYHKNRGIQIESSWASLAWLLGPLRESIQVVFRYGAVEIMSPFTTLFTSLAFYFSGAYLLGLFTAAWHQGRKMFSSWTPHTEQIFWTVSFLALAGFMFFNKVFSPQYLLWLIPLIPILVRYYTPKQRLILLILFMIFLISTYYIWPENYGDLKDGQPYAVSNLLLRNVSLLAMIGYCLTTLYSRKKPALHSLKGSRP